MLTHHVHQHVDVDALCGAAYGQSSPERVNVRNGYRAREFDTRAGTLEVAIPKLHTGSYFPDRVLERRRRAEAALSTCYLLGVSTRRMKKLVESLGNRTAGGRRAAEAWQQARGLTAPPTRATVLARRH